MSGAPSTFAAPVSRFLLFALVGLGVALVTVDVATGWAEDAPHFVDTAAAVLTLAAPILLGVAALEFVPAVRGGAWAGLGVLLIGLGFMTLISGYGVALMVLGSFVLAGGLRDRTSIADGSRAWMLSGAVVLVAGVTAAYGAWFVSPSGTVTVLGEVLVSGAWAVAILSLRTLDRRRREG